jgi:hypothetical protein
MDRDRAFLGLELVTVATVVCSSFSGSVGTIGNR